MAFEFIQSALAERRASGLLRTRHRIDSTTGAIIEIAGKHFLNFSSNDYLGMRQSQDVLQSWVEGLSLYGAGSGASPLVTGFTKAHGDLEDYLAQALGREAVLLFNSGFAANQVVCQALLSEDRQVIADKLMHASFIDGAQASGAKLKRFKHNDIGHLSQLLESISADTLVATEGVFSMDGDTGDVASMLKVIDPEQTWLMLDDAHGFGVSGETGLGTAESLSLTQSQVPVLMGTFGKAVGTAGAFVAGSQQLIDYLVNFARHYIYSTAMPPAQAVATLSSIKLIRNNQQRTLLQTNIALFKSRMASVNLALLPSDSPIQPIVIGDPERVMQLSDKLKSLGIWVNGIRWPTVPKHSDRLRVTITADHSEQDIHALVDALQIANNQLEEGM